jgi:uroporphyrin-III C-methyltransferase
MTAPELAALDVPVALPPETPYAAAGGPRAGVVYLVGAGPGDPGLITVLGLSCLRSADAVLYDRLVHPALVAEAPPAALRIDCGKEPGRAGVTQEQIHRRLVALAGDGLVVVRLKGGDPFVFGRGGEEAAALTAAGVPWRVVPGITSALAAPAAAGIPVTHRGVASSFSVVTGHGAGDPAAEASSSWPSWAAADTVVALMAVGRLAESVAELLRLGKPPDTPAALVERATLPGSRTLVAPLAELPARAERARIRPPATLVVGAVVRLREALGAEARPTVLTSFDPVQMDLPLHALSEVPPT